MAGFALAASALPVPVNAQLQAPRVEEAPIALLYDMSSGQQLHGREVDRRFLPASVTKVMTAYVAFELIDSGQLEVSRVLKVRPETARAWSNVGSSMFVLADQRIPVHLLLHGITTVSANDACVVLAEGVAGSVEGWTALMNRKAAELGMTDSYFSSPNGYPDQGRTYTSARDLVKLADALIARHPKLYAQYFGKRTLKFNEIIQNNHDPVTGRVNGADGIKTGYTREAGYNFLGSAQRDGHRLVMMVAGVDSARLRDRISREYLEWGFAAFTNHSIFRPGARIGEALVQEGSSASVPLVAPRGVSITLPKGRVPHVTMRISYRGPLQAPIAQGQKIAELEISGQGFKAYRIPLVAGEDVSRANFFQRIWNGIRGLF